MVCSTERFVELAIRSWPEWYSEPIMYNFSNFIVFSVSGFISVVAVFRVRKRF